jgi:hypothetical protein
MTDFAAQSLKASRAFNPLYSNDYEKMSIRNIARLLFRKVILPRPRREEAATYSSDLHQPMQIGPDPAQ